jgi:hypothetical protein
VRSCRLTFPAEVTADAVAEVLTTLAGESRGTTLNPAPPTVLETVIAATCVSWWVRLDGRRARRLQATSERALPGMRWDEADRPDLTITQAVELRATSDHRLLDTDLAASAAARLLGVASEMGEDERILVQWQIGSTMVRSPIAPASTANTSSPWWSLPEWTPPGRTSETVSAARKKQEHHVFAAVGRIAVAGATGKRAHMLIGAALGGYHLLRAPGVGISVRRQPSWWVTRRLDTDATAFGPVMRLTAGELAAVIGWPIGNPALPGVRYPAATRRPIDARSLTAHPKPGARIVGTSAYPAHASKAVVLRTEDALRHLHVLGPTGVGKSTLLANLILSDIRAGRGVVAIDPKGDLADEILARLDPADADRVVVIDPSDSAPVGLNPLDGDVLGIDGVLHVMRSLWAASWGPRLGDALHAGLLTLAAQPGHSLAELPVLLTDEAFRRPLVRAAVARDRLGLGTFWPWFDALSDDARAQVLAPIMNKLRAFLLRPQLRAVLGQASPRFDLNEVFTRRAVVLVRLPKGELGSESAQLFGSLLVAHLWRLTLARTAVPADKRHPVFLYLDEFQEFLRLPVDLADALVQARGLGVGLVLAHQHLDQLDKGTRPAVLANTASRIAFRLDHDDATIVAKRSRGSLRPEDLAGLGPYEAYASLLVSGDATPYGSIQTLPLPPTVRDPDTLRAQNRTRYGVDREVTETALAALLETGSTTGDPGPAGPIGGRRANPGDES